MMRKALIAAVGLTLGVAPGCVTDMDELKTATTEAAITMLPVAGSWDYKETSTVTGTCNAKFRQFEDGAFGVDSVTSNSFRIVPRNGTPAFTCNSNTTGGFSCPTRASLNLSFRSLGIDMALNMRAVVSGVFVSNRHVLGKQDLVINCSGAVCPLVGPNPCGYVVNFEARKL
jgi:hypothetical protein